MMKKIFFWFLKRTGVYNEIYQEGFKEAGNSIMYGVPYWIGHTNTDIKPIGKALEAYGKSFQNGIYPDHYRIREKFVGKPNILNVKKYG